MARTGVDAMGAARTPSGQAAHPAAAPGAAAAAGAGAELLVNATAGLASVDALRGAGVGDRPGSWSWTWPTRWSSTAGRRGLAVTGADSLGGADPARVPRRPGGQDPAHDDCEVMARPDRVPGDHVVFVAGEDDGAKQTVAGLLADMGWKPAIRRRPGRHRTARSTEMVMPLWLALAGALGTADFNFAIARA
jgi:hypothetical protein